MFRFVSVLVVAVALTLVPADATAAVKFPWSKSKPQAGEAGDKGAEERDCESWPRRAAAGVDSREREDVREAQRQIVEVGCERSERACQPHLHQRESGDDGKERRSRGRAASHARSQHEEGSGTARLSQHAPSRRACAHCRRATRRVGRLGRKSIGECGGECRRSPQLAQFAIRSTSFGDATSTISSPFIRNSIRSGTFSFCRIMNSEISSSMWR